MTTFPLSKVKSSGKLYFSEIAKEYGVSGQIKLSQFYKGQKVPSDVPDNSSVPSSGKISFSNLYDTSKYYNLIVSSTLVDKTVNSLFTETYGAFPASPIGVRLIVQPGATVGRSSGNYVLASTNTTTSAVFISGTLGATLGFASGSEVIVANYGSILGGPGGIANGLGVLANGVGGNAITIDANDSTNLVLKIYNDASAYGIMAGAGAGGRGGAGGYSTGSSTNVYNGDTTIGPEYYWYCQDNTATAKNDIDGVLIKWNGTTVFYKSKSELGTTVPSSVTSVTSETTPSYTLTRGSLQNGSNSTGARYSVRCNQPFGGSYGGAGGGGYGYNNSNYYGAAGKSLGFGGAGGHGGNGGVDWGLSGSNGSAGANGNNSNGTAGQTGFAQGYYISKSGSVTVYFENYGPTAGLVSSGINYV